MPENDEKIFGEAYEMYNRYRWRVLKEEDFLRFSEELIQFAARHDWQHNPLAEHMAMMLFDTFNDLYSGGKAPQVPDYFGRSDL